MVRKSWVDKYRPTTLEEFVGQEEIVRSIKSKIRRGSFGHHLFLSYKPGTGKTSLAEIIARMMFAEEWPGRFHKYNASNKRGIDVIRHDVGRIARFRGTRIIFLDEADNMTDDAQQALRGLMEAKTDAIFILTGNYAESIIEPITSRCTEMKFKPLDEKSVFRKLYFVCKNEGIEFDETAKQGLKAITKYVEGDLRKAINMLDNIVSAEKNITPETVETLKDNDEVYKNILHTAIHGDTETAMHSIEKQFILSEFRPKVMVRCFREAIKQLEDLELVERMFLFKQLANLDIGLRLHGDVQTQLLGFVAECWKLKHYPR